MTQETTAAEYLAEQKRAKESAAYLNTMFIASAGGFGIAAANAASSDPIPLFVGVGVAIGAYLFGKALVIALSFR